jgi:ATP-binding cassette subfamily C protein CydD
MVALAMLGSVATITISWALAFFISQVFIEHSSLETVGFCFNWLAAGGFTKALVAWMQELLATRAAASVKQELRRKYFDAVETLGPKWLAERSAAEINLLATSGLDSLEPYFAKYLPQLVYTAMVTPVLVAIIVLSDFSSGITLLVTLPLIPVFMILIGWATRSVQQRQLESLTRLSQHFLEVLRGLTTLKIFNRVSAQETTLTRVSREHRERTMKVLRVSFLSGFALELISSLAVALVAVSIGLRLLSGDLTLMVGLFVLLLAPEAFLPLRQVGAQFHASAEGVAAAAGILDVIDAAAADKLRKRASITEAQPIQYAFAAGKLTVITGPSGIGKSTIFKRVLGFDGEEAALTSVQVAWLPQNSHLFTGSVAENIVGPMGPPNSPLLGQACDLAAMDDLDLNYEVGVDGSNLSGGQAQRVCLARAFYRALDLNVPYLLLDEPISALDERRANRVIEALQGFSARNVAVVAITHQKSLIEVAGKVIEVK